MEMSDNAKSIAELIERYNSLVSDLRSSFSTSADTMVFVHDLTTQTLENLDNLLELTQERITKAQEAERLSIEIKEAVEAGHLAELQSFYMERSREFMTSVETI